LKKAVKGNYAKRIDYAEELSKEEDLSYILDLWLGYLRRVLLEQVTAKNNELGYSLKKIEEVLDKIQKTKRLITTTNVKKRLALETLMIKL